MYVTPDVIGVIIAILGAVATLFGGFYVMLHRLETRMDLRFERVDARFDKAEASVNARFDKFETSVDEKFELMRTEMHAMGTDIVDLKVAVARFEGPQPTLIRAR